MSRPPEPSRRRNLWPLCVGLALGLFAVGLVALIVAAVSSNSDLVAEDYYEQEIRYQEQLDRLERASGLDEAIAVTHDGALGVLLLRFPAAYAGEVVSGEVHLYRPSAAGLDRKVPLALNAAGQQVIPAGALASGRWQVKIRWAVRGKEYYVERRLVIPGGDG